MSAFQELSKLRERLVGQIGDLQAEVSALDKTLMILAREDGREVVATTAPDERYKAVGLSDAIRQIVETSWISPLEVRDKLMLGGYPNADKSKLLGSVSTTMKRLSDSEFEVKTIHGKAQYRRPKKNTPKQSSPGEMEDSGQTAESVDATTTNKTAGSRRMQIHQWLKEHGPSTRKNIVNGTGVPDGTVGSYLGTDTELFGKRDGLWLAH